MNGQVLEGKWKEKTHQDQHKESFDSLVSLIYEFDQVMILNNATIPRLENGMVDLDQVPISLLVKWSLVQAQKPAHKHGENNEISL